MKKQILTIWPLCVLFMMVLGSCRKSETHKAAVAKVSVTIAPELRSNMIGSLPGAICQTQKNSPIHWQPWTQVTMNRANAANRLVFGVIAMPQDSGFQSVLATLSLNKALVSTINNNYVPILIDGDASREVGILAADLCAEIKHEVQFPLFIWMTPDGNPIAWIPVSESSTSTVVELFNQSNSTVRRIWADDPAYVVKNSALNNENRRSLLKKKQSMQIVSKDPAGDTSRAIRQLTSLYDSTLHSMDEVGGLFPSGTLDLLATAAMQPGLSVELRAKCLGTSQNLLNDLLSSPMFDPLDGGVFSRRRGITWDFPVFVRDCNGQARVAIALLNSYRATGDEKARDKALELIAFAERNYATADGLFAIGLNKKENPSDWLWSIDEIKKELPTEDANWWMKAANMHEVGNLPSELDSNREFFRKNTLSLKKSVKQLAMLQKQPVEEFKNRFENVREKLLNARNRRINDSQRDTTAHAGATFRMVSAYAAAYSATGDSIYREKAVALLTKAKKAFAVGPQLRLFTIDAPASINEGRAFLYGLALQAANDVAVITTDDAWLDWCENLDATAAKLFVAPGFLKECPDDAKIIDLPVTDQVMLFDDSTAGLISMAECRLAGAGRPMAQALSDLATPLPIDAVDKPVLHTDLLQACLAREFKVTLIVGPQADPTMKLAIERLPIRIFQRRRAITGDDTPPGSVKIIFRNQKAQTVASPEELKSVLSQT